MANDRPYPVLDLFSGYGGFSLAFEAVRMADANGAVRRDGEWAERERWGGVARSRPAFRTIGFSEIDPYASAILAHRWPDVPNLGPVQHVTRDSVLAQCGVLPAVITGGFPCQPHSMAGKRGSVTDERDLWDDCWRILRDIRPQFALFENVGGLLTSASYAPDGELVGGLFFNRVLSDLAAIRYACQWHVVSAADVGAPHRRERVWLLCVDELAHGHGIGRAHGQLGVHATEGRVDALGDVAASGDAGLADAASARPQAEWRQTAQPRGDVDPGGEGCAAVWPAAAGLWPARPGEPQYGWEPSRVTGPVISESVAERVEQCLLGADGPRGEGARHHAADAVRGRVVGHANPAGLAHRAGQRWREETSGGAGVGGAGGSSGGGIGQAQPRLGRDVDGHPNGPHAAPVQVREAEAGDAVNRVHRLKALGNGIVPAVAHIFALAIRDQLENAASIPKEEAA